MNDMVIQSSDGQGLRELALFAGAGGGILGGQLLGWRTVCAVERDAYAAQVLAQRQNDGILEPFPIWSNVSSFDGKPWRGIVDVVSGGFPCQDISAAGKGAGITGARSGLWKEFARIIGEVRPRYAFIENSPMLTIRGLETVLCDLAAMGFDAEWGVISAADCGAPHQRERLWIASSNTRYIEQGQQEFNLRQDGNVTIGTISSDVCKDVADTNGAQRQRNKCAERVGTEHADISSASWWKSEPAVGRVAHGVAYRVDRLKAIGNGQVPLCAATAFRILTE